MCYISKLEHISNYKLILQGKNIILIDKFIIYKIMKGTRKVDLLGFIDYGYRRVTVRINR